MVLEWLNLFWGWQCVCLASHLVDCAAEIVGSSATPWPSQHGIEWTWSLRPADPMVKFWKQLPLFFLTVSSSFQWLLNTNYRFLPGVSPEVPSINSLTSTSKIPRGHRSTHRGYPSWELLTTHRHRVPRPHPPGVAQREVPNENMNGQLKTTVSNAE